MNCSRESALTASRIDHTLLRPEATKEDILKLCQEALENDFGAVFVHPCRAPLAVATLASTSVRVGSVAGFPFGANQTKLKIIEAEALVAEGVDEIDMVMNIGWLMDGELQRVEEDIRGVRAALGNEIVLKVIIESAVLPVALKRQAAQLVVAAEADFVKTSTGLHPAGGATLEDVTLLKEVVGEQIKVKAAGGIRNATQALQMIQAGADRIGTSSGVEIIKGLP
ncbi:MAG: deoxyribose-phosphate aldolase [Acidobacteriota bacterium]